MRFSSSSSWALCLSAALACATFAGCDGGTASPEPGEPEPSVSPDVNVDGGNNDGDAGSPDVNTDGGEPDVNTDGGTDPDVVLPPADPQAACDAATALVSGVNNGTTAGAPNNFIASCVGDDAPDAVFSYTVTKANAVLIATALNDTDGFDVGVSIRTTCMDDTSELGCKDSSIAGSPDTATADGLAVGDVVFIIIDGWRIDDSGDFTLTITEQTQLASGADCTPGDTDAVCIGTDGDACATDGDGTFSCQDPVAAKCEFATALALGDNSLEIAENESNAFAASCSFSSTPENVYRYVVQGALVNVIAASDDVNIVAGSARTTCDDSTTQISCASAITGSNKALGLTAGQEIYILIEGDPGAFTLNISEEAITTLNDGTTCLEDSDTEICDPSVEGLACLTVGGADTCQVLEILERGIACNEDDTGKICNRSVGDSCLDDGTGNFFCLNPLVDKCEAGATTLAMGTPGTAAASTNVTNGSCVGFSYDEVIFDYTVVGDRVNVTITGGDNVSGIHARTTCEDPDSQKACDSAGFDTPAVAVLLDVTAGELFSIFAEVDGGGDGTLTAVESAITLLTENTGCDPDDIDNVCDSARGLFCIVPDGADMGTCTDVGMPNDVCENATPLGASSGEVTGFLHLANNDYDAEQLGDCTSYYSKGDDLVYSVILAAGETIALSLETEGDSSLFILDACPATATSCVAGSDSGDPEEVTFVSEAGGTYFVVVDTYSANSNGGNFSLSWTVTSN